MSESLPLYWAYSLASQAQGLQLTAAPAAVKEVLLSIVWEQKPIKDGPLLSRGKTPLISIDQGVLTSPYQLIASPSQPSPGQRQWLKLVLPSTPAITQLTLAPVSAWFNYLKLSADQQQVINYRGLFEMAAGTTAPSISEFKADLDFWPALTLPAASDLTPLPDNIGLGIDFNQDSVQQALAKLEERIHHRNLEREHTAHSIQALNSTTEEHQAQLTQLTESVKSNSKNALNTNLFLMSKIDDSQKKVEKSIATNTLALNNQLTTTKSTFSQQVQQLETQLTAQATTQLTTTQADFNQKLQQLETQLSAQATTQLTTTQADFNQKLQQLDVKLTQQVTALEQQQLAYSKALIDVQQQLLEHAIKIFSDINA